MEKCCKIAFFINLIEIIAPVRGKPLSLQIYLSIFPEIKFQLLTELLTLKIYPISHIDFNVTIGY